MDEYQSLLKYDSIKIPDDEISPPPVPNYITIAMIKIVIIYFLVYILCQHVRLE